LFRISLTFLKLVILKLKITPNMTLEDMCKDGWRWKKLNPNGYK